MNYLVSSYCFTVIIVSSIVLKHNVLSELEKKFTAAAHNNDVMQFSDQIINMLIAIKTETGDFKKLHKNAH